MGDGGVGRAGAREWKDPHGQVQPAPCWLDGEEGGLKDIGQIGPGEEIGAIGLTQ